MSSAASVATVSLALATTTWLVGCGSHSDLEPKADFPPRVPGGDARRGALALREHDCGVCHVIPGIAGARGRVGPSLAEYSRFPYLAGKLPNQPGLLVRWIADAPSLAPQTAMPPIAMNEQDARDIAAYLYRLE
jgi:mono/diheme cytochrome c family protein